MATADAGSVGRSFLRQQDRLRGGPADELCTSDYTAYIGGYPPIDIDGHKKMALMFYGAFPDLNHTIDDTIAEGDKVVVRFTLRGTHLGDLMGIPPTGKAMEAGGIAIFRIANGKVAELREQFDEMGMMRQIGAIPEHA